MKLSLIQINQLSENNFINHFSEVIEHSRWVAEKAYPTRPFRSLEDIHKNITRIILEADPQTWIKILNLHPRLSNRITSLTRFSVNEQESLGLTTLNQEEEEKMTQFNEDYFNKFGFPFVVCVRLVKNLEHLFITMEERIMSTKEEELNTGIKQVLEICRLRLESLVSAECREKL